MKSLMCVAAFSGLSLLTYAQQPTKKPLDHTVYDGWQSIGSMRYVCTTTTSKCLCQN